MKQNAKNKNTSLNDKIKVVDTKKDLKGECLKWPYHKIIKFLS